MIKDYGPDRRRRLQGPNEVQIQLYSIYLWTLNNIIVVLHALQIGN